MLLAAAHMPGLAAAGLAPLRRPSCAPWLRNLVATPLLQHRRGAGRVRFRERPVDDAPTAPTVAPVPGGLAADGSLALPLDYYRCLGLNRAAGREAVRKAYERVLHSPPDVELSEETLFSRAVLLRGAADCLADLDSRKGYDALAHAGGYAVDVTTQALPGALVLLQESGASRQVLELGSAWLAAQPAGMELGGDVAAAMALAYCDLAACALEQSAGTRVSEACQHLEASLHLLRKHRQAPQLQQQLRDTLEEYSPRYCLELLSLPQHQSGPRARGLALLRKLAFEGEAAESQLGQGPEREAFLASARTLLTPSEHLDLYSALPASVRTSAAQKLDAALACVAVAYQRRQPWLVMRAARTYAALHAAACKDGLELDVSVEQAACSLLLGDAQGALALLGLGGGSTGPQPDEGIRAFVLEHSPEPSDLLPGLYALTQCWVEEAVLGSFRAEQPDGGAPAAPLSAWFESRWVQACIMVHSALRRLRLFAALRAIPAAAAALLSWLLGGLLRAPGTGARSAARSNANQHARRPARREASVAAADSSHSRHRLAAVLAEPPAAAEPEAEAEAEAEVGGASLAGAEAPPAHAPEPGEEAAAPEQPAERRSSYRAARQPPRAPRKAMPVEEVSAVAPLDGVAAGAGVEPSPMAAPQGLLAGSQAGRLSPSVFEQRAAAALAEEQAAIAAAADEAGDDRAEAEAARSSSAAYMKKRMQLQALEAAMWDSPEEDTRWAAARSALPVLALGLAAALAAAAARERGCLAGIVPVRSAAVVHVQQ